MKLYLNFLLFIFSLFVTAQTTSIDTTYGINGIATICNFTVDYALLNTTAIQNDEKIVFINPTPETLSNPAVLATRINPDGSIDTSYGTNGSVFYNNNYNFSRRYLASCMQADNKLVIVGFIQHDNDYGDFCIMRLLPNGSLDTSFATNGNLILNVGTLYDFAYSVIVQPDGKILVGGASGGVDGGFCLIRLLSNGSLDPTFGTNGKVVTIFAANNESSIKALALKPDGKIIAAGTRISSAGVQNIALARYMPNGILDTSFGTNGKVETPIIPGEHDDVKTIKLLANGKIFVLALHNPYYGISSNAGAILVKYTDNGQLDSTFGINGKITEIGSFFANDMMILENDKIMLTGYYNDFALARYLSNGAVDMSFGTNGKMVFDISQYLGYGLSLYSQPINKIIACSKDESEGCFKCIRLNQETLQSDEFVTGKTISIYPNPNKGTFTIRAIVEGSFVETSVYDISGKLIFTQTFNHEGGEFNKELSTNLPAGFYMVNLKTPSGTVAKKLVIE